MNEQKKIQIEITSLSKNNLQDAWNFLKRYEKKSIALVSHLIQNNKPTLPKEQFRYFLICQSINNTVQTLKKKQHLKGENKNARTQNTLLGVFMISKSGLILHQLGDNLAILNNADLSPLENVIKNSPLYSIVGSKDGTEFFQTIIAHTRLIQPQTEYIYHYLVYSEKAKTQLDALSPEKRIFPTEYKELLKWNTVEDLDTLVPIQMLYDKQEVVPPFKNFDPRLSKANLKRLLLTQKIVSLYKDGDFIAKAGTNAQGLNWVQLGGVCTKTTERNRGYAQFLVQTLIDYFQSQEKKHIALFVKENNESAKKAYTNLGFVFDSYFKIVYYESV